MGAKQLARIVGNSASVAEVAGRQSATSLAVRVKRWIIRRRTLMNVILGLLMVALADGSPTPYFIGLGMLLASQVVRIWAAGYINKDEDLVTNGPFACTRNPLYLSNMVAAIGFVLMCGRWELLLPVLAGWFILHLPTVATEEEFLQQRFGDKYHQYCQRVPRWLPRWPAGGGEGSFQLRRVLHNREHVNILGSWLMAAVFFIEMVK